MSRRCWYRFRIETEQFGCHDEAFQRNGLAAEDDVDFNKAEVASGGTLDFWRGDVEFSDTWRD